jgi:hypothetical protein
MNIIKSKVAHLIGAVALCMVMGAFLLTQINPAREMQMPGIGQAHAQAAANINSVTPLTRDLGAILTVASKGAGAYNSVDQTGFNVSTIVCLYNQTAGTGTTSNYISLQNKDAASGTYYGIATAGPMTTATGSQFVAMGKDLTSSTGTLSAGYNVISIPVARTWRVQGVVSGSATPQATFTVGCSVQ